MLLYVIHQLLIVDAMEELTNITQEALQRYFITLSQFGYRKYSDVFKLIVLLFIEETLLDEWADFVDEEDYRHIIQALYCLYGSTCLIDFPVYEVYDSLMHDNRRNLIPRVTEDSNLRSTECDAFRVKA